MTATLTPTLSKENFENWLKAALSVLLAKEGLIDFVGHEIIDFQRHLLQTVYTQKGIPPGTTCSSCTTANVLACPTAGFCSKGKRCKAHDSKVPDKKPNQLCPNGLCSHIRDAIKNEHRYKGPSWINTNARGWCSDSFELSKCYMPPDGYSNKTCLADTDFNGLLAVVNNNIRFQRKISVNWGSEFNICTEAGTIGREIRYSANHLVSDQDLQKYIDVLISLLSDPAYLAADVKAKDAVGKLKQLKKNTLTIHAKDITDVLNDSIKTTFDDQQKAFLHAIQEHFENHRKDSVEVIDRKIKESVDKQLAELKAQAERGKYHLSAEKRKKRLELKLQIIKRKDEIRAQSEQGKNLTITHTKKGKNERSTPNVIKELRKVTKRRTQLYVHSKRILEEMRIAHINTKKNYDEVVKDQLWIKCLAQNNMSYGYEAILNKQLPSQKMLDDIVAEFGKKSPMVKEICDLICLDIKSTSELIVDVWPATKNDDSKITFVVTVNETDNKDKEVRLKKIKLINYSFVTRTLTKVSDEGKEVMYSGEFDENLSQTSAEDFERIRKCINAINSEMMKKHKYLTMISLSPLRSKGYGTQSHILEREPCIVLHVLVKGYIPIQEDPFDRSYFGVPVDVREGFVTLFIECADSYHTSLKNGCQISKSGCGTLGGFVDYPGFGICGLTCAHVLLNSEQMKALSQSNGVMTWHFPTTDQYVYQPNNNTTEQSREQRDHKAGRLVKAIYREGGKDNSGMDIAIFQIESRYPVTGCFPSLRDGRPSNMCFDTGETAGYSRLGFGTVTKFGASTDITDGTVLMDAPYLSIGSTYHNVEVFKDFKITLHNLLEVKSLSVSPTREVLPFAMPGDSGSLVFSKNKDDKLFCVGVLEGGTSNGTCFVMPISPILEELKLSSLKNFEKDKKFNHIEGQLTSLRNDFNHLSGRLDEFCSKDFSNFQTSIDQNIQQKLDIFTNQQTSTIDQLLKTINERLPAPATPATKENQNNNQ